MRREQAHYGVTLLNRTTRSLTLTEEGRTLVDGARFVLKKAEDLERRVRCGAESLSGGIRIAAPLDLGRATVAPIVDVFLSERPMLSVDLLLSDGYVTLTTIGGFGRGARKFAYGNSRSRCWESRDE